jgi:hypothetical protein
VSTTVLVLAAVLATVLVVVLVAAISAAGARASACRWGSAPAMAARASWRDQRVPWEGCAACRPRHGRQTGVRGQQGDKHMRGEAVRARQPDWAPAPVAPQPRAQLTWKSPGLRPSCALLVCLGGLATLL